ncbi:hypothetical protein B0H15DRAFT_994078 [Mycena belliarum]|uniref:Uncharacterized protein n=1 Tax=Mycena belliarum TaxID=1033014 RepID=A0AAD6U0W9_9AGAR|nr:hypothetical protein B0H15DRAFT_994078 [Mycena belliae]
MLDEDRRIVQSGALLERFGPPWDNSSGDTQATPFDSDGGAYPDDTETLPRLDDEDYDLPEPSPPPVVRVAVDVTAPRAVTTPGADTPMPAVEAAAQIQEQPPQGPLIPVAGGQVEAMQIDDGGHLPAPALPPPPPQRFIVGHQLQGRDKNPHAFVLEDQRQADGHNAALLAAMEDVLPGPRAPDAAAAPAPPPDNAPVAAQAHVAGQPGRESAEVEAIIAEAALRAFDDDDLAVIAQIPPANSADNPHGFYPAAANQAPARPEDIGTAAPYEPNVGEIGKTVSSLEGLTADATAKSVKKIMDATHAHLLLVLSNGGGLFFSRVKNADEVFQDAIDKLIGEPGAVQVYHLPTDDVPRRSGVANYGGTICLAVHVPNPGHRIRLLDQRGIYIDPTYGATFVAPEDLSPSWVVIIFKVQARGPAAEIATELRATRLYGGASLILTGEFLIIISLIDLYDCRARVV